MCSAYNMLHEWDSAIVVGRKAVELNPNSQLAKNNLNVSLEGKNKVAFAENTVSQHPTAENYLNLSLAYYNEGRYRDCAHAAEQAVKLKPDYDLAYSNICIAYTMIHEYDKAIEAGKKAVEINPKNAQAKANLDEAIKQKKAGK